MKTYTKLLVPVVGGMLLGGCVAADGNDMRAQTLGATYVEGNPSCADLGLGTVEFKVDQSELGDTVFAIDQYGNTVTITSDVPGGTIDWATNGLGIDAVIMKGGPNAMVYEYDPEATSDTGLETPFNDGSGKLYGISHISFCYDYELTVSKTAATSFTRTHEWDITKSVDVDYHEIPSGGSATSNYTVTITNTGYSDSDFEATGTVTVANNTPFVANVASITDQLSNGVVVALDCDTVLPTTLTQGNSINCTYEIGLGDATSLVNTATATVTDNSPVEGNSGTANVDFGAASITELNGTVNIEDDFEGAVTALGSTSTSTAYNYSHDFTCEDEGLNDNIATIVETEQSDSASVRIVCLYEGGSEGCTPGYWKNHADPYSKKKNGYAWGPTGYEPTTLVNDVFATLGHVEADATLYEALDYSSGPRLSDAVKSLIRAATASLLDAAHPDVDFPLSPAEIISRANAAIASGDRGVILTEKDLMDQYNNLGCPL